MKAQAQADAAAQDDQAEEEDEDNRDMVNISNQLGMEVGHEEEDEESDDDESEPQSKPVSRNVSEIVAPGASQRPVEPKPEEKQLSKKVCMLPLQLSTALLCVNCLLGCSHSLTYPCVLTHRFASVLFNA